MIKPVILYGCETWTLTSTLKRNIVRFERKILMELSWIRVIMQAGGVLITN